VPGAAAAPGTPPVMLVPSLPSCPGTPSPVTAGAPGAGPPCVPGAAAAPGTPPVAPVPCLPSCPGTSPPGAVVAPCCAHASLTIAKPTAAATSSALYIVVPPARTRALMPAPRAAQTAPGGPCSRPDRGGLWPLAKRMRIQHPAATSAHPNSRTGAVRGSWRPLRLPTLSRPAGRAAAGRAPSGRRRAPRLVQ
jgi:hypothetical protein